MGSEQYKGIGTVSVTNASQVVVGASTDFSGQLSIPCVFKADKDGESTYSVAQIVSATRVLLAANYLGSTDTGIDYIFCRSFTTGRGFWRPLQGDADFAEILSQETIDPIDTDIANIISGDASIEGTKWIDFGINTDGNAARLSASHLSASRYYRFPDQNATMVGLNVEQNFNASQRFNYVIHGKHNASIDGTLDVSGISHFRSTGSIDGKLKIASALWGKATASIDGQLKVNATSDFNNNPLENVRGGNVSYFRKETIDISDLTLANASQEVDLFGVSAGDMIMDIAANLGTPFKYGGNATICRVSVGDNDDIDGFGKSQLCGSEISTGYFYEGQGAGNKGAYLYNASLNRVNKIYTSNATLRCKILASNCFVASLDAGAVDIYVSMMSMN